MNFAFKKWFLTNSYGPITDPRVEKFIACSMIMCHKRITFAFKVSLGPKIEKSLKYSFGNDVYQCNSSLLILSFAISALMESIKIFIINHTNQKHFDLDFHKLYSKVF